MAKATIVSLYPIGIDERIAFIYPSRYIIPASDGSMPSLLIVSDPFYYFESSADRPPVKQYKPAANFANNFVSDFINSSILTAPDARPALFFVEGEKSVDDILNKYAQIVAKELKLQRKWFETLVKKADDDWQQHRTHKAIPEIMRIAATQLGLAKSKDWAMILSEYTPCPGCGNKVSASQAVCSNCKAIINNEAYSKLKFAGV